MGFIRWISQHINVAILFTLVLGLLLRVWQIGQVPKGITHDELGYIFNAYSIATSGKNIFGEFLPLFTWMALPYMPGTIYGMVPFFLLLPLSPATGRLPGALLGVADIFLLYVFVYKLFRNKWLSILSAVFLAISPWHLHFSRSAYDPNFALFFYLIGILVFLHEIEKKKLPIFSSLLISCGVYSYRGMSIIAFPLMLLMLGYAAFVLKASKKQLFVFGVGFLAICLSLILVIALFGKAYIAEGQAVFRNPKMQEAIDTKIREAEGQLVLRRIFINKPSFIISSLRENYIRAYSPEYLFLYTEPNQIYSIWSRGRLYFIDLIFIILGMYYVFRHYPKQAWLVIGLLLIGGLPGGIGGMSYSARNYFLSIIFPIITALGVISIFSWKLPKKILMAGVVGIVVVYTYMLGSYLFDYYFRYASQGAEAWAYSFREVTTIINNNKNLVERVIVAPASLGDVVQYSLYTSIPATEVQKIIHNKSVGNPGEVYSYENVQFMANCEILQKQPKTLIITRGEWCLREATPSSQIRDFYRNTLWRIYD